MWMRAGVEFYNGILVPRFRQCALPSGTLLFEGSHSAGGRVYRFRPRHGRVRGLKGPEERQLAAAEADRRMWRQGIGGVGDGLQRRFLLCRNQGGQSVDYLGFLELFGLGASSARGAGAARTACGGPAGCLGYGHPPCYLFLQDAAFPFGRGIGHRAAFRTLYGESCERELFRRGAANWLRGGMRSAGRR